MRSKLAASGARPFLRWAGSKKKLLPVLAKYWRPDFTRYVEPFCGSASLFYAITPKRALLTDINLELIEAMQSVQTNPELVYASLAKFGQSEQDYYGVRSLDTKNLTAIQRSARFIYLNGLCFNGLFRVNAAGEFNVPYGGRRTRTPSAIELKAASRTLQASEIRHGDFETVLEETKAGDFVYLDPPYATSAIRVFREYGVQPFCDFDLHRLKDALESAESRGVKFLLSYLDVPELGIFPSRWSRRAVRTRRNIAGFTGARRTVQELLLGNT
ncbi:MAG: Dam family site-specific DNA-(adenine-N6)-methyltransferase [Burkholderiales bacterium]|nr:Dam family site-specific DNA-(adenine-N6)-methyltransferase [Burkholderiales bacterium]